MTYVKSYIKALLDNLLGTFDDPYPVSTALVTLTYYKQPAAHSNFEIFRHRHLEPVIDPESVFENLNIKIYIIMLRSIGP